MALFSISGDNLKLVQEKKVDLEKDLQYITELNLAAVFGLTQVSHEFSLHEFRIDSLAFDDETKSFVIIEYKRDKSFSVVDQGFAYLSLMLNNKADFILEYNEKTKKSLKRDDVDWSQSRVLFLANSFTSYQQNAIRFKDLPIELWEVKKYDNESILYNQLKSPDTTESINTISSNKVIESVSKEVRSYSVEDHFKSDWTNSREIFDELRRRILNLDNRIEESPQKYYIGYKFGKSVIFGLTIQKMKIIVGLSRVQPKDLNDPNKKVIYRKNSFKYYNKHISDVELLNVDDIDYAMFLIKQVYDSFLKNQA